MRISKKKNQADGGDSKEGKRWMIAGISLRAPLKPVTAKHSNGNEEDEENHESGSITPTSSQLRVAVCPPAPRKRRPESTCGKGNREFYTSPEIDSFFKVVLNTGRAKC
ncbi:cyclin-dependent protein kinase inhibitor SMR6-like [Bidens hawaiensis]|uniref:cyclin-dependent protein kinase inhibitor SMR6-like n=1 Tax=Bidens hawaiensis TaxID=980011 RepID=UPI004049C190